MEKRTSISDRRRESALGVEAAVGPRQLQGWPRYVRSSPFHAGSGRRAPSGVGAPCGASPVPRWPTGLHALGQSIGLADGGVQVNGQGPVAGSCPGLRPGPTTRGSPGRVDGLAPPVRRKVPRVDGALTVPPRVQAVPPVRNTSASSMQSPPASAEATLIILSPVRSPAPGHRPGPGFRCRARVAGRSSPALATRRWSSPKRMRIRSGWSLGSVFVAKPLSPGLGPPLRWIRA